jgi:hypothetical protein
MHSTAVERFAHVFVVANSPFCPFWSEGMWQEYPALRCGSEAKFVVQVRNCGWGVGGGELFRCGFDE